MNDHIDLSGSTFHDKATGKEEHHHHYGPAPTATSALPAAPAVFTGRDAQVDELLARFDPSTWNTTAPVLITAIAGLGGIGKTALALHTAHAARKRGWFPGGTLFIDLHGYDDTAATADQAVLSLLRAIGIRDTGLPPTPEEQYALYRSQLARREPVLLLLDNASDSAQIAPLLPGSSGHLVLVTSRDTLGSLPARLIHLDALEPDHAVSLIARSLRLSDPADDRTVREPGAALQLAALCGHLPLTLRISAAQLRRRRHRPIAGLVTELQEAQDRLDSLHAPGVDQYGRSMTLRPVFDVIYRRLKADQARLFLLLALSPTPDFGGQTAAALAHLPEADVLPLLDELAAASLVTPSSDGERWRMHDLVRAYARLLMDSNAQWPEVQAARGRVLAFYREWTDAAGDHLQALQGDDVPDLFTGRLQALAWLDSEQAGLVAAALWARNPVHAKAASVLGMLLYTYLDFRRYFEDMAAVMRAARDASRYRGNRSREARAWGHLGTAQQELRQFDEALRAQRHARDTFTGLGDRHSEAVAGLNVGIVLVGLRRFDEAVDSFTRARGVFTEMHDRPNEAGAWNNLGNAFRELKRSDEAIQALSRARDTFVLIRARGDEAGTWLNLGITQGELREFSKAADSLSHARDIFAELGDRYNEAMAWNSLGITLRNLRRFDEAIDAHTHAREIYIALGGWHSEARTQTNLGNTLRILRRFDQALEALRASEVIFLQFEDWYSVGQARQNTALLFEGKGRRRRREAKAAWMAAADAYTRAGADEEAAEACRNAG